MLRVQKLRFSYRNNDASDALPMCFDLEAQDGEILSLIGPSGSGKSSLLHLIAGFISASSGAIFVNQRSIVHLSPAQRPLSLVFQSHNLFPHLDVQTNIALGIQPSLKLSLTEKQKVDSAITRLGLQGLQKRKPGQLSGGQQQRVAIARALVRQHQLLLLDEPFSGLGPALREELILLLRTLITKQNITALMVSHQPSDALLASSRTAFIYQGRVFRVSDSRALLKHSTEPEILAYLGSL